MMKRGFLVNINKSGLAIAVAFTSSVLASLAGADDTRERSSGFSAVIEEVVVTARRREEGLQDAPIAISAYTGDSLDYRGITKLDEISRFAPSLTLENNPSFGGASNSAAIYLRGVGQKEFLPTTEPGVGLYVDGVYIARSVGAILDLVDIERLEVLRGPQGTLFGRNTIGGAISITTIKPEVGGDRTGSLAFTAGTDQLQNFKGSIESPFGETLAARISLASFKQDGHVQRADGIDLGNDDTLAGRLAVNWEPTDAFSAQLNLDVSRDRENGPAMELIGIDFTDLSQLAGVVLVPPPPMAFIHNVTTAALGPGQPCAVTNAAGGGVTTNPASANCYDNRYVGKDGSDKGTAPAYSENDTFGASVTLNYDVNDAWSLKSITAVRQLDSEFARDGDHSPHRISQFSDVLDQDQFTQEFQLLGTYDKVQWTTGLYYFSEEGTNTNILDFTVSNFRSGGDFDNEAWAAFAQVTYDVTEDFHVTLGGRYTDEQKSFTPDQIIFENYYAGISDLVPAGNPLAALDAPFLQAGGRILPLLEKEIDVSEFTPAVNFAYDISDDLMIYFNYSEGFKSGGFTQRVFPPVVVPFTAPAGTADIDLIPTYDPEFVDVSEVGFKGTFNDGTLRINGALFSTDYEELQVQVFNSVAPVTRNLGQASIEGLELEALVSPGAGWLIEGSFAYLNAGYESIDTSITLISESFEFERVPEFAASLGVSKEVQMDDSGTLIFRADWSYRAETFNDAFNTPTLATDSVQLVDASVRWISADEDWLVTLSGRNLTDDDYLISGVYGTAFQSFEGLFDRGREWRLELRRDFN
jgi:iron complex outermembrane receptor protein